MAYLLILVILLVILLGCLTILAISYMRLTKRNEALRESIENLGKLNDRLRMDRHDYLNHLQVIYGLMELEEYEAMNAYLKKVYKDLLKTGKAIKTSKPALNALLAAKLAECDSKNIEMVIEVKSDLKEIRIEDWDLCKIISNLTDNAIRALLEADQKALPEQGIEEGKDRIIKEKHIRINITETPEKYIFEVEDNGPKIPENIKKEIFKKGFTTKKDEGHGMGLAIVSQILDENKGTIELNTDEEKTVFTVNFEKEA